MAAEFAGGGANELKEFFNITCQTSTFPVSIRSLGGASSPRITGAVLPRIGGVFTGED
jgi:hypothetical protein